MKPHTLSEGILGYLAGRQLEFPIFHIFWWVILLLASSPGFSWFLLLLASPPLCNAMQWKSFHLDAAAVNQSEPTIGRESTSGTRPFWKAAQIVTIEEKMCENAFGSFVSAVIPVGAQLSICGIQSIITSFSRTKWKKENSPRFERVQKSVLQPLDKLDRLRARPAIFYPFASATLASPAKKWSKWNAKLRRPPFFLGRDKVETCFEQTEILLTVSIYPIKWWIGNFATLCHSYILSP